MNSHLPSGLMRLPALLVLLAAPLLAEGGFLEYTDSGPRPLPWLAHLSVGGDSAGPAGDSVIRIRGDRSMTRALQARLQPVLWERFYFRVRDTGPDSAQPPAVRDTLNFFNVNFYGRQVSDYPSSYVAFSLIRSAPERFLLLCRLTPSREAKERSHFQIPVFQDTGYCLEFRFEFPSPDSVGFALYLNGDSLFGHSGPHYPVRTMLFNQLSGQSRNKRFAWGVDLRDPAVSGKRLFSIPAPPGGLAATPDTVQPLLQCAPYRPPFTGERVAGVEYLVERTGEADYPVYFDRSLDPAFFFSRRLPFPLDSGAYRFRMRFRNNFGHWSGWSAKHPFTIPGSPKPPVRLLESFVSAPGRKTPLPAVSPGNDYDLHCRFTDGTDWRKIGFLLVTFTHSAYRSAHPGNRGGFFYPESNYTFNLSFEDSFAIRPAFQVFEKIEGSQSSRTLIRGKATGRYFVGTERDIRFDRTGHEIAFRFRLLDQALPGRWFVMAAVFDSADRLYHQRRSPVTVAAAAPRSALPVLLGVLAATLLLFAAIRLRRKTAPAPAAWTPDLQRIADYLNQRLAEEITVEQARKDLRLSSVRLYRVLKENNIASIPRLQNQLRIERARELIRSTEKTLSEICFEVGFKEPPYFTKVFKEMTGTTPSEYRRSLGRFPAENSIPYQ